MYKKLKRSLFLAVSLSSAFVAPAFAVTAQEVMDKAVANIVGPPDRMVMSEGKMVFSRRNLDVRTARYYHDGTEGFQIDVLSPLEDQEVPGSIPQTDKKYRVVRRGRKISTLAYLPSLRRGRKINYVPLDGLLGSDFPYYFLPLVSDFTHDFTYTYVKDDPVAPVIAGSPKDGSRAPYTSLEVHLQQQGPVYLITKAVYDAGTRQETIIRSTNFSEYANGYWAPAEITVKDTTFTFDTWIAEEAEVWLHSTNHNQFDAQRIPQFRKLTSN